MLLTGRPDIVWGRYVGNAIDEHILAKSNIYANTLQYFISRGGGGQGGARQTSLAGGCMRVIAAVDPQKRAIFKGRNPIT